MTPLQQLIQELRNTHRLRASPPPQALPPQGRPTRIVMTIRLAVTWPEEETTIVLNADLDPSDIAVLTTVPRTSQDHHGPGGTAQGEPGDVRH